ncbi:MAG: nitrogenase component 1 [Anaerovoracaceae bacterium]|jgi:nitrogenase molybdenum-cofactor synthesis protein NifE
MNRTAYRIRAGELAARIEKDGRKGIPEQFIPNCHLIYSSPATLAYNSPGAVGFGVKRAALTIPESVMLLVSPMCCGRNSTILSQEEGYVDRMFYLLMNESDLVNGRHLNEIPEAIREILEVAEPEPKVVVICITCADALLGTDLERVCRKAQEETGVLVVPSYMYALEREGRKPPMVAVRKSIYSLLERGKVEPDAVNLMGFFSALDPESELFALLHQAGIRKIHQIADKKTLQEYREMGNANFSIVLHPEAVYGAEELRKRIGMPYIELARLYDPDRIRKQYRLFGSAIGVGIDDREPYEEAVSCRESFMEKYRGTGVAVGEMANANPFELSASLTGMGLSVKVVFSNVTSTDFPYIRRLAQVSPETEIYTGIEPSMVDFVPPEGVELTIGKDAGIYIPDAANVPWNSEVQPFGHRGFTALLKEMERALSKREA